MAVLEKGTINGIMGEDLRFCFSIHFILSSFMPNGCHVTSVSIQKFSRSIRFSKFSSLEPCSSICSMPIIDIGIFSALIWWCGCSSKKCLTTA